ncbi:DUF1801 domain-containing protein [Dyadobacter psychrotolerans]|uniref:DUF1801 domain-containing protein n=1 Tax=Dyadobacter psychrotolerans TaxID=2541721 RepID=A0A4R5DZW8_9BACT|nr:DUF1801 domain-containing protein [Dyadobacter psychrotolerans]TDE18264.1 DUF1801 domain-containing protein [Dyadobacter psychrotolerans]
MTAADNYFYSKEKPLSGCLLALRQIILNQSGEISEIWSYKMPFYCITKGKKTKRFCYLWTDKKSKLPYLGIVDGYLLNHPELVSDNRTKMKIFYMDPEKDLPVEKINLILQQAIGLIEK